MLLEREELRGERGWAACHRALGHVNAWGVRGGGVARVHVSACLQSGAVTLQPVGADQCRGRAEG